MSVAGVIAYPVSGRMSSTVARGRFWRPYSLLEPPEREPQNSRTPQPHGLSGIRNHAAFTALFHGISAFISRIPMSRPICPFDIRRNALEAHPNRTQRFKMSDAEWTKAVPEPRADEDSDDFMLLGLELSDREVFAIGQIVSLWGALEHEIFLQTLDYFDPDSLDQLPKEMNNVQPSKVLELWKVNVVDKAEGERREVLQHQYNAIQRFSPFRHAIVHGMWEWSRERPETIDVIRVRKDELLTFRFTADDLSRFWRELAKVNFKIRYPGGLEDYAAEMTKQGGHISRQFIALATNSPSASDWFGFRDLLKDQPSEPE
jgi:hypothetical protein